MFLKFCAFKSKIKENAISNLKKVFKKWIFEIKKRNLHIMEDSKKEGEEITNQKERTPNKSIITDLIFFGRND